MGRDGRADLIRRGRGGLQRTILAAKASSASMKPRHYCTYLDSRYLTRGLALYESLRAHAPDAVLHVLCLDDLAYSHLAASRLPGLRPIELSDVEAWDPALAAVKSSRSALEYYFTCAPETPLYVLAHTPDANDVTNLDADLYFFRDPAPIH